MFTGIIKDLGLVESFDRGSAGARMRVRRSSSNDPLGRGESIAVNGVCLTALPVSDDVFDADLSPETLAITNLGSLDNGDSVNLERAMTLEARLSGHIVQGHVDCVGSLLSMKHEGDFAVFRWSYPREYGNLVVSKGSIAVDGISLTIVDPDEESFAVALIPETLQMTNLGRTKVGAPVNLEFDVMAKLVAKLVAPYLEKLQR